jgi:hypothetical protein
MYIQGVSEIRMLILTSGRTHQFIKLFSITFCKIHKIRNEFVMLFRKKFKLKECFI